MPTDTMLAFVNTERTKPDTLNMLRDHAAHDRIVKGVYWENRKGCAVGCMTGGHRHDLYPSLFGIPEWLAHLEDAVFEGLPNERAMRWPIEFVEAVPVGADLDPVRYSFFHWLLVDPDAGVVRFVGDDEAARAAIIGVAALHERAMRGDIPARSEWAAARDAAWAAARDAAWAAAWAATGDTARAAAWDAAWAAAWVAARDAHWTAIADKLLELLRAAPVKEDTHAH